MQQPEHIDLVFTVTSPFGNLYRPKCVLIAAEDSRGLILVGSKPYFYPPTITRLLGGGVDEGEDITNAAVRELEEELSIRLDVTSLRVLAQFDVEATDSNQRVYKNQTTIYHAKIGDALYRAGDDVKSIMGLTKAELFALGEAYESLPETLWYKGEEGTYSWADYAKMYGPIHKTTAEMLLQ